MRIIFMGSPADVIPPLQAVMDWCGSNGGHLEVVSQPARPAGRRKKLTDPPLAEFARQQDLPLHQPERASSPEFLTILAGLKPDLIITAAYGQILSEDFLAIPTRGTINIHPSLLPEYRGAIPVPAALLDGKTETGISILFTVRALDAGSLILQKRVSIDRSETAGDLTVRLFRESAAMLPEALALLQDPEFRGQPQDESRVTHCRRIAKEEGRINWSLPATTILNRFRAFEPWPGSWTETARGRLKIMAMEPAPGAPGIAPGQPQLQPDKGVLVGTGDGAVLITRVKPAGGKDTPALAWWNGLKPEHKAGFP